MTMVLRIFLKLLKPQSPTVVFYTKKIHMDAYVDTKDYFDKRLPFFSTNGLFWTSTQ